MISLNARHEQAAKTAAKVAHDMAAEMALRNKERDQLAKECDALARKLAQAQAQLAANAEASDALDVSDLEQRILLLQRRHAALAQQLDARTKERNDDARKLALVSEERDALASKLAEAEGQMVSLLVPPERAVKASSLSMEQHVTTVSEEVRTVTVQESSSTVTAAQ